MNDYMEEDFEYRGMKYWRDKEGYAHEGMYTLHISDGDYNEVKGFSDQSLDLDHVMIQAEAFIDGYLLGLAQGKEIGANNLRHDLKRLLNMGAAL